MAVMLDDVTVDKMVESWVLIEAVMTAATMASNRVGSSAACSAASWAVG